jgi:predicted Zn-dependent peptidase
MTIGLHDHIQAATFEDVVDFYRTWYVPANATLVIAGDIDPDEVNAAVDQFFGSFPRSERPHRPLYPIPTIAGPICTRVEDTYAALPRIHRAWHGPLAFDPDEPELDILTGAWCAVGTGALWRRLVYETQLAQRVSTWTTNGRLGGEVHVAVDLKSGGDPDVVRKILDEECAKGVDAGAIARQVTRREAAAIWSLSGLSRRTNMIQRYMLYTNEPDGLAADLARYRSVTPASIEAAMGRWLGASRMIEVETVPLQQTKALAPPLAPLTV